MTKYAKVLLLSATAVFGAQSWHVQGAPDPKVVAIVGATMFDGTGAAPHIADVIIEDGRIVAVGNDLAVPKGAQVIKARGKALLPGFFDLHTHWATSRGFPTTTPQIATAYVQSGVTTVNDYNQQPESFAPRREWLSQLVAPHVNFAARLSTPGGHGADWADEATTITVNTPNAARYSVDQVLKYKPDLIKVFADGWRYGTAPDNTSMDEGTLRALAEEAHKHNLKVVTHTVTVDKGEVESRAGVDSLAHAIQDRKVSADTIALFQKNGTGMVPTMAVYSPYKPGNTMTPERLARSKAKFDVLMYNVKVMHDAGVQIGVGTDAGETGTPHGSSTLLEMQLLVKAGLTPAQALVAGTKTSAQMMGLDKDRGTIEVGKRADLVLIDGKPWITIDDVTRTDSVLIDGKLVFGPDAHTLPATNIANRLPSVKVAALVDDFERKDGRSSLDTLRLDAPDGGVDRTLMVTQIEPRQGGGQALLITGRMATKDNAYAGVAIPLTRGSVVPVDVRGYTGVRFDVRGAGTYVFTLNGLDGRWRVPFETATDWTSVSIDFAKLAPLPTSGKAGNAWTGDGITQIEFGGSRPPKSKFWLSIDNVTFY